MTTPSPVCINCAHFLPDEVVEGGGLRCKAFDKIPDEIIFEGNEHEKPFPDQENDLVFTPIKKD